MRNIILVPLLALCFSCGTKQSAYQTELAEIENNIEKSETNTNVKPADQKAAIRLIYYLYLRATLSANFLHFKETENAIENGIRTFGNTEQLLLFRSDLNFKLHRYSNVEADLTLLDKFSTSPRIQILRADLALQQGQYQTALQEYENLANTNSSWENLARLAYFYAKTSKATEADVLYEQAQEKLSVKEMRHYAWLELQRGLLDLDYGRYEQALAHYQKADRAYSGYYLIQEHMAEAYGLLGKTRKAIKLYRQIIANHPQADLISALADLLKSSDSEEAKKLYQLADKSFSENQQHYPEATGGHLIEHLLAKDTSSPQLLDYAVQNHQLRPNAEAKLLLAKVFLKNNNQPAAVELIEAILATPWRTPEIITLAERFALIPVK